MNLETTTAVCDDTDDYWSQTRRPLLCLVFLAPLLAIYEAGLLGLDGDAERIRNGADAWMRSGLAQIGLAHVWLLPGLVVVGLLGWHVAGKFPWRISAETLAGMLAESLLFACLLVVLGQLQDVAFQRWTSSNSLSVATAVSDARFVALIGAGVYEEVLFRLCLLPACYGLFRLMGLTTGWAAGLAVLSTSLTFSLAHYLGPAADSFTLFSFTFRTLAGAFFAALFVLRGFGITVGCHTAYDLLVGLLLNG